MGNVIFTAAAAKRLSEIKDADNPFFRVRVNSGGCNGFQYEMDLASEIKEDDVVIETEGEKLLIDPVSMEYMDGSTVDYVEEMIGSAFKVLNPQASSSCGCGVSFSV